MIPLARPYCGVTFNMNTGKPLLRAMRSLAASALLQFGQVITMAIGAWAQSQEVLIVLDGSAGGARLHAIDIQ